MLVEKGKLLVPAIIGVTLLLAYVTPETEAVHTGAVVKQLNTLQDYLKELEFLEEEEKRQGHDDSVEQDTIIETCELMVVDPIKIDDDDDFAELVEADLNNWDECYRKWSAKSAIAEWNFETDMTDENEQLLTETSVAMADWTKQLARNAQQYIDHPSYANLNDDARRRLRLMAFVTSPNDKKDEEALEKVQSRLQDEYSKATVVGYKLEPDLTQIMATSRDSQVLLAAWLGWRNATGPNMRQDYAEMIGLLNKGATDNGFSDYAAAWIASQFDSTDDLEEMAERLWLEIKPLYEQLHAYLRTKLSEVYPEYHHIFKQGGIPAHLSGNMWAQEWNNIYDLVKPYPDVDEPDIDDVMIQQGYSTNKLFDMAEDFYVSIGMYPMSDEFNSRSMKERPDGREVVCHAAAFDFYSAKPEKDFRIKMCTEVNMEYFETIHHEMGHIEYFMAYQDQPAIYRTGANSAFHEAVGDTISLSVMSNEHLETVGLLGDLKEDLKTQNKQSPFSRAMKKIEGVKSDINFLMKRALFKIAFIPFGYMIDKWRWEVFRGDTSEENYNQRWWELRLKYQGIVSPVPRSELDFDPGAKFHIPSNSPYICYFISFIVQFQFYESMCEAKGHKGPLHTCDFYQSKEAGEKLLDMLKLGMSKPWPEAMEKLTGSREISTDAILRYFSELHQWLITENEDNNAQIGWENAQINWKD